MAAANIYPLSSYPSGLIRRKEDNNVGHIFRTSDSPERNCGQDLPLEFWSDPAGLHRSERNYVDVNPEFAEFDCRTPGVALKCKLARSLRDLRRKTVCSGCAHVHDPAPLCSSFEMPARKLFHHQGRRTGVHGEHSIVHGGGHTFGLLCPQLD